MGDFTFLTDDQCQDVRAAKRRRISNSVPCCDPACLRKPCYERACHDPVDSACPDPCPADCRDLCTDDACLDICTDNICEKDCLVDSRCLHSCDGPLACHDPCQDDVLHSTCLDACHDPHQYEYSCLQDCHCPDNHERACQHECNLSTCADPCLDYTCGDLSGIFDEHTCGHWAPDSFFHPSSLSTSPYNSAYSSPSHFDGSFINQLGHVQDYNTANTATIYPAIRIPDVPDHVVKTLSVQKSHRHLIKLERITPTQDSQQTDYTCLWAGCTALPFSSPERLHNHVKTSHSAKTPNGFVCMWTGCESQKTDGSLGMPYSAATKNHFHRHMQRHTSYAPHECPTCTRHFKTPQQLKNHLKTHTGEKQFKCAYCSKSFALLDPLRIHERLHKNEKRFECPICGDRGADSSNMSAHRQNVHGTNSIPCPEPDCSHRDSRAERLKLHMRESDHQTWRLDDVAGWAEYCRLHRLKVKKRSGDAAVAAAVAVSAGTTAGIAWRYDFSPQKE